MVLLVATEAISLNPKSQLLPDGPSTLHQIVASSGDSPSVKELIEDLWVSADSLTTDPDLTIWSVNEGEVLQCKTTGPHHTLPETAVIP